MILYLAGGVQANLKPLWRELITAIETDTVDLYLADSGGLWESYIPERSFIDIAILESFYYADEWTEKTIPHLKHFMLDSGAFTFMQQGEDIDWDSYVKRYADFINRNHVEQFIELDIDSILGYDKVLYYRKMLEDLTGKRCIPAWHKSRGFEDYEKTCEEYPYIAIGGIAIGDIHPSEYRYFPKFIKTAHRYGCKVHGLGFTSISGMKRYHFDSVDSTAWTTGNRFGAVYRFDCDTIRRIVKPEGTRLSDPRQAAINNFNEWVKFQRYAETHL